MKKYADNWKMLNPEYDIMIYDNEMCEQFLLDTYGETHRAIFNFLQDGPIKADFWRICILYKYGGIYSDIDNQPLIPIRDFLEPNIDFATCSSYWDKMNMNFNPNFIVSAKNNIVLEQCIEWYLKHFTNKKPYDYWEWSIMRAFTDILILDNYNKTDGIYSLNGMRIQIIKECPGKNHYDAHNTYKGVRIFNNRYSDWDYNTHSFCDIIDLSLFEHKMFSQNGEDGVTMKLLELIYDNPHGKYYVEFGVESGIECNTRILREKYNWSGLQMDGSYENNVIGLRREFITKENVTELFKKYNVPSVINVLSVDIDFNDFYCLKEILNNFKCDIIICEYNATHMPNEDKIVIYDKNGRWDGSNYFGASLLALSKLGKMFGYSIIYCDKMGVNCFFIRNDIIENKHLCFLHQNELTTIYNTPKYGNGPNGGHYIDVYNRPYLTFAEAISL